MGLSESKEEVTYLCGNSLGLMPKAAKAAVDAEMDAWAGQGVIGHHTRHDGKDPWVTNDERVAYRLARLVFGCLPSEISYTGTLTANLNALLQAFYKPTKSRFKLICEAKAFPSDIYSFQNQVKLHGLQPDEALILLSPDEGEDVISTEKIINTIKEHGNELALVCLPGIQFYTGQYFDIPAITKATKDAGAVSGWDLAHASGNVPLYLHEWGVDFAVFCSYKYLNSGPGNLGGLFVHEETAKRYKSEPRAAGWWGVDVSTRFEMRPEFVPAAGARGFAQSNVCLFGPPCIHASLDIIETVRGIEGLQPHSRSLTGFMSRKLHDSPYYGSVFRIMTDKLSEEERGCQLSIAFNKPIMDQVNQKLMEYGIVGDERKPSVIRLAPNPLYNTHVEVEHAVECFNKAIKEVLDIDQ